MNFAPFLLAEVNAPRLAVARAHAEIVATCAQDVGVAVQTQAHAPRRHDGPVDVTLHLPAEYAAEQHPAWCLACRLACFCPDARVSVLVHGETEFLKLSRRRRTEKAQTA